MDGPIIVSDPCFYALNIGKGKKPVCLIQWKWFCWKWCENPTDEENPGWQLRGTISLNQPQFPPLLCPKESSVAKFSKTHYLSWVPTKNLQADFLCEERSRTSQKMKATSSLSAELLLCNFRSSCDQKISCCQDFQNALPPMQCMDAPC